MGTASWHLLDQFPRKITDTPGFKYTESPTLTKMHSRQTTDTPGFKPFTKQQSFKDNSHPDNHTRQTTDTPGFKPFTNVLNNSRLRTTLTQTITLDRLLILLG